MLKGAMISVVAAMFAVSVLWFVAEERYARKEIYAFAPTALTVEEIRVNLGLYRGHNVSVVGVLNPLFENGAPVNAVLIPNKDFLEFPRSFMDRYFVTLEGVTTPSALTIKEECFGEFVSVTGTADTFGGRAAIKDIVFVVRLSGGEELDCLDRK